MDHIAHLYKRLRFDSTKAVWILRAPDEFDFPDNAELSEALDAPSLDQVLLFVQNSEELLKNLPGLLSKTGTTAILWIAYPKIDSGIRSDLSRDVLWRMVEGMGRRPVGQVPLNDRWSALWFKYPELVRSRKAEYPEIDLVNKVILIPDDLRLALEEGGLLQVFEKMTFSHKREHVEAVLEAKKPETRSARIAKCLKAMQIRMGGVS